jgi:hypothetical protein
MGRTLYDNHNINYTEWFEVFKEYCMDNDIDHTQYNEDSERFINWLYDSLSMDWDDLMTNIKYDKNNNVDCVVTGSLGLWDGRHDIDTKHFPTLDRAINACISGCDYIIITENEGVINIKGIHHDGTNNFEIHKLNDKGYDAHCDDKDLNNEIYFDKFNFGF